MRIWKEPEEGLLPLGTKIIYEPERRKGFASIGHIVGYPTCVTNTGDDGTYIIELNGTFYAAWDTEVQECPKSA